MHLQKVLSHKIPLQAYLKTREQPKLVKRSFGDSAKKSNKSGSKYRSRVPSVHDEESTDQSEISSPMAEEDISTLRVDELKAAADRMGAQGNGWDETIEFKNCKSCGSAVFDRSVPAAIKCPESEFKSEQAPMMLLANMFTDQLKYSHDHLVREPQSSVHRTYFAKREEMVDRLFAMGKKFKQRQRTVHVALEIMDRYFLDPRISDNRDI